MNLPKPQKLIYDMEKFAGGAIAVLCGCMLTNGKRNLSELKQAIKKIYQHNDALRIRINDTGSEVCQYVTEYKEQDVKVLYFENKVQMDAYAENYAKIPLDFCGNLCEINLVVLPDKYGILVKLHHIIGDAWTSSLIGTQFNKILNGDTVESESYIDYIKRENTYLQSKRYKLDEAFFIDQFEKCNDVIYISEKQSSRLTARRKTFVIDSQKTQLITSYARENAVSVFMIFTAALAVYMNRTKMNVEKFYIGTAVLNRNNAREKNTMGMFVNTVPMLIELDNAQSFAENLSAMEQTAFSVFRHQKYNYGDMLATIRKDYGFSEKLYDVIISYQNAMVAGADCDTTWYHSGEQSESLQMHIDDRDSKGVFRIHYDYLIDKFTEHEIDMLHQHICNLLFDAISK